MTDDYYWGRIVSLMTKEERLQCGTRMAYYEWMRRKIEHSEDGFTVTNQKLLTDYLKRQIRDGYVIVVPVEKQEFVNENYKIHAIVPKAVAEILGEL